MIKCDTGQTKAPNEGTTHKSESGQARAAPHLIQKRHHFLEEFPFVVPLPVPNAHVDGLFEHLRRIEEHGWGET